MQKPSELTKEQIEQMRKFAELPAEKKVELLEKQCIFCQIAKGNVETVKVYEDPTLIAALDINPATTGHTLLFPKKHFQFFFQMPSEVRTNLFELAGRLSIYLVNLVSANGINLYAANGLAAGQRVPHFVLHLIPRFEDDGISFDWEAKKASKKELENLAAAIRKSFEKEKPARKPDQKKVDEELERELKKFRRRA